MTDGVKLLNADPNNTSMWLNQFSSSEPMNLSYGTQLDNLIPIVDPLPSNPTQISYNSGAANPLAVTEDNSQSFNTDDGGIR